MMALTAMNDGYGAASFDIADQAFMRCWIEIQVHPDKVNVYLNAGNGRASYRARAATVHGAEAVRQFAAICDGHSIPTIAADWVDDNENCVVGRNFTAAQVARNIRNCVYGN